MRGLTLATCAVALAAAACSRPADPPPTGEEWVRSVTAWRAKHEADYRREYVTIAGLHFLEPGTHTLGSAEGSDIVLPAGVPPTVGTLEVAEGWVRFAPADSVAVRQDGAALTGATVLKEPGKDAPRLQVNDVTFAVHESGRRLSLRVWDPDGDHVKRFAGYDWFEIDPAYQVVGTFLPDPKPVTMPVANTYGDADIMTSEGVVEFTLHGETLRLRPFTTRPNRFWFVFRDGSSGVETYETARFLYADLREDGTAVLDFNQAYNPPCAFNPHTTCPIPLKENRLAVKILAGEKAYAGH